MKRIKLLALAALAFLPLGMQAQKLHENASLETSHLWRGLEVGNVCGAAWLSTATIKRLMST